MMGNDAVVSEDLTDVERKILIYKQAAWRGAPFLILRYCHLIGYIVRIRIAIRSDYQ
jgi:hypothetical protein